MNAALTYARDRERQYGRRKAAKADQLARPRAGNVKQCAKTERLNASTAGIISLLTHICISVPLIIVVHPKLTYQHQSPYSRHHKSAYTHLHSCGLEH